MTNPESIYQYAISTGLYIYRAIALLWWPDGHCVGWGSYVAITFSRPLYWPAASCILILEIYYQLTLRSSSNKIWTSTIGDSS